MKQVKHLLPAALACMLGNAAFAAPPSADWPNYGRTAGGDRHSPLTQIDRANVGKLTLAWEYKTGEAAIETGNPTALEATPLVIDGVMYLSTPLGKVVALDPVSGQPKWVRQLVVEHKRQFGDWVSRGVSFWRDPKAKGGVCHERIIVAPVDARLVALDAATGDFCAGFGNGGVVDLVAGLRNKQSYGDEYEQTSPPAIIGDLVVVGSAVADNSSTVGSSGEVRAFDARTGALRWTWSPVPQDPKDPAYATWNGEAAHRSGGANTWSIIAADPKRDLVFLPTTSPAVDYYGVTRLGDNRYANSIVALRASTGKMVWNFQTVHHDLWDYDNASPPALITLPGGKAAVLQGTKTAQLFVLDRETGAPLFPVEERAVPKSDIPGEVTSPTQPLSSLSTGFRTITADDIWGATPEDLAECRARFATLRYEGPFTPPSERGSLQVPANIGGAHWGGVAYDSDRGIAIVPNNRLAAVVRLIPRETWKTMKDKLTSGERVGKEFTDMRGTPYIMQREIWLSSTKRSPCTAPPFGTLTAFSLKTGKTLWDVPLGTGESLDKIGLSPLPDGTGMANLGGAITTAGGLVFIGATLDAYIRAFDIETGQELWKFKLPAGGKATPMTYQGADGRQYVVISAGGDGKAWGKADSVVAFALPKASALEDSQRAH
ncbi:MAG TPA: pyrroloquinoline quinone-dependent dehydrogenase [Steroidobacteraceae bacterium]|jgi:quinoprotein glucose dehydrogenase|nr:pyrroloquinoline quinone-dependent dehydrogenase [Steroidobacteraceae bacterium]